MFRRFPFVTLICWVLTAVIVFGITGAYKPGRQIDARDFSVNSERIRDEFSILHRVDSFDFNKIRSKVVHTMPEQQRVEEPDRLAAGKFGAD